MIVDDDEDVLLSAKLLLKRYFTKVVTAPHPRELNRLISTERPELILLDMNFRLGFNSGEEGLYWLQHIKDVDAQIPVILMTAFGEIELAVEALKLGASDFILKPWQNEKLMAQLEKTLPSGRMALPKEMAGLAVLLASPAASYMTGGVYANDGGYLIGG